MSAPVARRNRAETRLGSGVESPPPSDIALLTIQGKTADLVWTKPEWESLAHFLHNENNQTNFVMAWRKEGRAQYSRSRTVTVGRMVPWTWRTITDEVATGKRTTFVPYSQNSEGLSRWGCLDFDAHDGDYNRARQFAFAAWQFLLNSDLTIIVEETGRGWHVWCISKEFRRVRDWTLFLRGLAKAIDAPVRSGRCEVFPDDTGARHGKGVRAPGSWNPSTDSLNLILWENSQPLLSHLNRPIGKPGKSSEVRFTDTKSNDLSLYAGLERSWKQQFNIQSPQTRHEKLLGLVGQIFHKIGHKQALKLAIDQHAGAKVKVRASQKQHLSEFAEMWIDLTNKWEAELCNAELAKLSLLTTEAGKDAFRIIRNFSFMARVRGDSDFPVALYSLAGRLGISAPGAAKLLVRFVDAGILSRTAYAVIHRSATRYAWLPINVVEGKEKL